MAKATGPPHPPDCCFIETREEESAEDWRRAVEDILTNLWVPSKPGWWQPFTAGPLVSWNGRRFRSFRCWAGSVFMTMYMKALKEPIPRTLLLIGRYPDGRVGGTGITYGTESEFDGRDIVSQLARGAGVGSEPD